MNRAWSFALPFVALVSLFGCGSEETHHGTGGSGGGAGHGGAGGNAAGGAGGGGTYADAVAAAQWQKLPNGPAVAQGKQDDIFFLSPTLGFAASGPLESIYKTEDGGATWKSVFNHTGTYFRALLFTDPMHGFAGNLGAGLSPAISDTNVVYETKDGGATWAPVTTITGPAPQGICNFTSVDATHLFGVGRANGPAHLIQSSDGGASWTSRDLGTYFTMIIDAHFFSPTSGLVAGMGMAGKCAVMSTSDAGATFTPVFTSKTANSLCWKLHFPTDQMGYVAVQDAAGGPGTFGKTTDGGKTWQELPLPAKGAYPAIGVGFITPDIGWMSAEEPTLPSYRTLDGGMTWEVDATLKSPINRFRFVDKNTAYAIGGAVWKLDIAWTGP